LRRTAQGVAAAASVLGLLAATLSCTPREQPPPTITAQGFAIAEPRTAPAGGFEAMKLRIEAPAGIEELRVRERSYEADLAKSPETQHFPLFGLERRVWSRPDVTLDFAPYANAKLQRPGRYQFDLRVRDRAEAAASATLVVVVTSADDAQDEPPGSEAPPPPEPPPGGAAAADVSAAPPPGGRGADTLELAPFRLERVGRGPVRGGDALGIGWLTLEPIAVTIRLASAPAAGARLQQLPGVDFAAIRTRADLVRALAEAEPAQHLDLATANNAAAGAVFAVLLPGEHEAVLLRADESQTSLSEQGTTVTVVGHVKR
jgi:hypothetical protein